MSSTSVTEMFSSYSGVARPASLAPIIHKKGSFHTQLIVLYYGYARNHNNNELGGNYRGSSR